MNTLASSLLKILHKASNPLHLFHSLSLSLWLLLSPHVSFLPHLFTKWSCAVSAEAVSLAEAMKRERKGSSAGRAARHPQERLLPPLTQLAQPTQTNKQHCLFRSRVRALFHVFHQLAHLCSGTPSLSLPPSLSAPFARIKEMMKLSSQQKHFSAWINCRHQSSQSPWRGKCPAVAPTERRPHRHWHTTASLKTDINYTLHTRLYEWIICNCAVGFVKCFCADFTSNI